MKFEINLFKFSLIQIQEKNQQIQDKDQQILNKEQQIQHRDHQVRYRDQLIQTNQELIQGKDQEIQDTNQLMRDKDEQFQLFKQQVINVCMICGIGDNWPLQSHFLLLDSETASGEGHTCTGFAAAGLLKAQILLPLLAVIMHHSFSLKVKQLQMRLSQTTTEPSVISGEELTVTKQVYSIVID